MGSSTAATLANELASAERRVALELNEHALERRQEALFSLAKKAINDSEEIRPLLAETAALVADALQAACGAYAEPNGRKYEWRCALVAPSPKDARQITETVFNDRAKGGLSLAVAPNAEPFYFDNILDTPEYHDPFLLGQQIRSGVVCPMLNKEAPLGFLGVFDVEPRPFTVSDLRFVDTVAKWLGLIVSKVRVEEELHDARQMTAAVSGTVNALVVELSPQGAIQWVNQSCEEVTGFKPEELKDRTLWSALLIPNEVALVQGVLQRFGKENGPIEFDCHLLTKHGERRRMAWTASGFRSKSGNLTKVLATGLDVTEKFGGEIGLDQLRRQSTGTSDGNANLAATLLAEEATHSLRGQRSSFTEESAAEAVRKTTSTPEGFIEEFPAEEPRATAQVAKTGAADNKQYAGKERRSRTRSPYPYVQMMAPITGDNLPPAKEFHEIQCREISSHGFSFTAAHPPAHETIVVAFGVAPSLIYLSASIQHMTRSTIDGKKQFLIGCRYLGRVFYNGR